MKRIRLWLRELTLTQQLMTIVFLVVAAFAVFIFAVLVPQINTFTSNEMYRMLHSSQNILVYYLNEYPSEVPDGEKLSSSDIIHAVYDPDDRTFEPIGEEDFPKDLQQEIEKDTAVKLSSTKDYTYRITSGSSSSDVLYSIAPLEDGRYLISMVPIEYEKMFRSLLTNNIVNLNLLVGFVLFVLLTLWVASLIFPLNQIKNYIVKIKNDEPAELTVNRRDEIGEVADALVEMEAELKKQNREKQEMIQNISHDLKTPIATIKSYGESIKDGIYPYGTLEQSVDVIIEHADRLEKKVRSLIALNKMGYLQDNCPKGETLLMADVVDKVLLSLKVIRPEIQFVRNLDRSVKFHGDEDPWRIVVENLVDNALRYAKTTITIVLKTGELDVINDGISIDEDHLEKMFRPYEKGTGGQFGLGLSIVYKIVTTYGYHVSAENIPGGVKFRVFRELNAKEQKAMAKEQKAEEAAQAKIEKAMRKERKKQEKEEKKSISG